MDECKNKTEDNISDALARLKSGKKISENEVMLLIREGYFPNTSEVLKEIDPETIKNMPVGLLKSLRRLFIEALEEEGKIDAIMAIEGSSAKSNSIRLIEMLNIFEENLK